MGWCVNTNTGVCVTQSGVVRLFEEERSSSHGMMFGLLLLEDEKLDQGLSPRGADRL